MSGGSSVLVTGNGTLCINPTASSMTCKGDLRVQGHLQISGSLTINEHTLTGGDIADFIKQNTSDKRLRDSYPTVKSAWEMYQLTLMLCSSGLTDED
jgi:hypothetical protein